MIARGAAALVLGVALGACATAPAKPPAPPSPVAEAPPTARPQPEAVVVTPPAPRPPSARQRLAARHDAESEKLEGQGDLRRALDERKIALTIDPDAAAAREAARRLEGVIERKAAEHMQEGRAALARGSHVEARRRFLAVLALHPDNRAAFEALQNEARDVEVILHTVRQGDTLSSIAQRYYGDRGRAEVIWETNQLPPGARLAAGRTLKVPEIPGVPFHRTEPRREAPREVTARAEPSLAIPPKPEALKEEPPAPPEVNPLLAEAQEALDRHAYAEALSDVEKLLASNPNHPEGVALKKVALYRQGRSQFDAKKYSDSYRTLSQLARLAPNYENSASLVQQARTRGIDLHYSQGIRYYREEKLQEAIAEWRIVLELDPQHTNARRNLEQSERLLKGLEERRKR